MEVVLLWLDDLDDLLFSVALGWERCRRALLQIGLVAALGLAGTDVLAIETAVTPVCLGVALASVVGWLLSLVARAFYYRDSRAGLPAA